MKDKKRKEKKLEIISSTNLQGSDKIEKNVDQEKTMLKKSRGDEEKLM